MRNKNKKATRFQVAFSFKLPKNHGMLNSGKLKY